jgi:hypothetical protein
MPITTNFQYSLDGVKKLSAELIIQCVRDMGSKNHKIKKLGLEFYESEAFDDICIDLDQCPKRLRKQVELNKSIKAIEAMFDVI